MQATTDPHLTMAETEDKTREEKLAAAKKRVGASRRPTLRRIMVFRHKVIELIDSSMTGRATEEAKGKESFGDEGGWSVKAYCGSNQDDRRGGR